MALDFSMHRNSTLGRLARLPLRLIPDGTIVPILQGPARGMKWIVGASTHGAWLGNYEPDKVRIMKSAVRAGDVVFDIGANVGFFSLLASRLVGPLGLVAAFEPDQRNLRLLRRHIELNNLSNVMVFAGAVSDITGEACFQPSADHHTGHVASSGVAIRTICVDDFCAQNGIWPNHIKIDVEGSENEVLRGATAALSRNRPPIFLSLHGDAQEADCRAILTKAGYKISPISYSEVLAVHRDH